jgi:ribosomal protein S17E
MDFFTNHQISETSKKLYIRNLKKLNNDVLPDSLDFLKNKKRIIGIIKSKKPNTARTYTISIVSALSPFANDPNYSGLYTYYTKLMDQYNKDLKIQTNKTDTEKKNWVSDDELVTIKSKLKDGFDKALSQKRLTPANWNIMRDYVLFLLYTDIPPRRNKDYEKMLITVKMTPDKKLDKEHNYLIMRTDTFLFNNYKTKKTYSTQMVHIESDDLINALNGYIQRHPLRRKLTIKSPIHFLVGFDGSPLSGSYSITRSLNSIFNRKVSSSMLRKYYLTTKYGAKEKEFVNDVKDMGTSESTARNNYIKTE